jgi:hypothetical protein
MLKISLVTFFILLSSYEFIFATGKIPSDNYSSLYPANSEICNINTDVVCQAEYKFYLAGDGRCGCLKNSEFYNETGTGCSVASQCLLIAPWTQLYLDGNMIGCGCFKTKY